MAESIFSPIVPTFYVENKIIATIALWGPTYLAEVERQSGIATGTLERPRSVFASADLDNWPEFQRPSVAIVCSGLLGEPEKHAQGRYSGWFGFKIGATIAEQDEQSARLCAHVYQAALEALIAQQGAFGDQGATETIWTGRDSHLPDEEDRTLALAESDFKVWVSSIITAGDGPTEPDPRETPGSPGSPESGNEEPYEPWPEVLSTHVTVVGEQIAD
jgi:hypothetical protein